MPAPEVQFLVDAGSCQAAGDARAWS